VRNRGPAFFGGKGRFVDPRKNGQTLTVKKGEREQKSKPTQAVRTVWKRTEASIERKTTRRN